MVTSPTRLVSWAIVGVVLFGLGTLSAGGRLVTPVHAAVAPRSIPARSGVVVPPAALRETLDALMSQLHERGQFDGSILVAWRGGVVYRAGFGYANDTTREPFQPGTVSDLGSVSKQFTAMAVMMLSERGALGYDDPVTRFLPELARYAAGVTVRHLLNHTSGIPDVGDLGIDRPGLANDEVVAALAKERALASTPGTRYRYSNAGYDLLGTLVERLSGQRMSEFLAAHVFRPVGMSSTFVREGTSTLPPGVAMAYDAFGEAAPDTNATVGDGGVFSTVDDLYKWDGALAGSTLVGASTLEAAFTPPTLPGSPSTYGFG
jgi:CubicO group peptidase (beta-lactamase class C family)